jgi:hypothetical protein
MKLSGKSYSVEHPQGQRRKDRQGRELAPRSLRKRYTLVKDVPEEKLKKVLGNT